jgi:iron complex outermembrane recepter protein
MQTRNREQCLGGLVAGLLALTVSGPAVAQLEEIIVTAERRQESLQEVPIAVTAFTTQKIESLKIEDFHDLAFQIPGFSINTFSKSRHNPALRGGSSSLASAGAENAVGLFIDDVYFGGSGDFEIDIFDVERIEVLRGPQGTLFGRNTTGGLINVVTKDPGQELEGRAKASLGNYNLNQFGAYVAGPVTDNLAGSIALSSVHRDGTSYNSVTDNDVDNQNSSVFRGKLVWDASDTLEVKFGLSHSAKDETGSARDATSPVDFVDLDVLADQNFRIDDDPRTVQMHTDGRYVSEQWVGTVHVAKELSNMTLESITTGRIFDVEQEPENLGGLPTPIFAIADERSIDAFTQEFRLISNNDSALQWQTGVYLLHNDETRFLEVTTRWDESTAGGAFAAIFGCPTQTLEDFENFVVTPSCLISHPQLFDENNFRTTENVKTFSYSGYAQGTYHFDNNLSLTLGGRYTNDEKKLRGTTTDEYDWSWNPLPGQTFRNDADWGEFTWRAALDYQPVDKVLVYGSASTGFRSGAYDMTQSDPALVHLPVAPETVTNLEVGFKSRFASDRVQLNVAVFDTTYEDLQFYVNAIGAGGASATTNAGEATVEGVEVELTWAATDSLTFDFAYSHQEGDSKDIPVEAEIPEGTPPQGTVPNTYIAGLDYVTDIANGQFYFHADYLVKDEYSLEFMDNSIPQFRSKVDGMLNVNLGMNFENGWGVQIWGKNLRDENVVLYGQDFWFSVYGPTIGTNPEVTNASFGPRYGDPRTYGISLSYDFD